MLKNGKWLPVEGLVFYWWKPYGQEVRAGYHCTELGMHLCGELWGESEKCVELEHMVEGRQKHYLSLWIIAIIYGALKYQALCVVWCVHFR